MSYSKRGLSILARKAAFLVMAFAILGLKLQAAIPSSVSGMSWILTVTSGSGGLPSTEKRVVVFADSGDEFHSYRLTSSGSNDVGTFTYVQNAATNATLTLSEGGNVFAVNARLTNASGGTFRLTKTGTAATQSGTFQMFKGPAPSDFSNKVFDLTVTSGTTPFPANGHFHMLLHSDGSYGLKNMVNGQTSSGTYSSQTANAGSLLLNVSDSIAGDGFVLFAFSNAVSGIYSRDNGTGLQVGKFHEVLPPQIKQAPSNTSVVLGKTATLSARATGEGPLGFQWYVNGFEKSGATNSQLSITNVSGADEGNYYVTVSNDGGSVASSEVTLSVILPPGIATQPVGQTNAAGSSVVFSVAANGTAPFHYQWQFNGLNLVGKTGASLSITNLKLSHSGNYRVLVKNAAGSKFSGSAHLFVYSPVRITQAPRGYLANTNAKVLLSVSATGTAPLSYQWFLNGTNISGATKGQYIVNGVSATNEGTYSVTVANPYSSANATALVSATASPMDLNGDGQTDLLLRTPDGHLITWFLSGTNFLSNKVLNSNQAINPAWAVCGFGDFNHDGQKDILFQHTNTGALMVKFMQGTNFIGETTLNGSSIGTTWKVGSVADFDRDGSGDLVAQNKLDDTIGVWRMDGTNFINTNAIIIYGLDQRGVVGYFPIATTNTFPGHKWKLAGVGNFHAQGYGSGPDILTQDTKTQEIAAWAMDGTQFSSFEFEGDLISTNGVGAGKGASPGLGWKAVSVADFNFDGKADIIFQNGGSLGIWNLNGISIIGGGYLHGNVPINSNWRIVGPK
jgi:hypothetical protein